MKRFLIIPALVSVFLGCMQPKLSIQYDRMIGDFPAQETVVESFERYRCPETVFPAGIYLPVGESWSGIYYLAPEQLRIADGNFDGGIFLYYDNPSRAYLWATIWGATHIERELLDFKFKLRHQ